MEIDSIMSGRFFFKQSYFFSLEKNLYASRPSEHPLVRGKNVKTFGIVGCKDKTSSWQTDSPMVVTLLGQQYNVEEKPTVVLYTYHRAGTSNRKQKLNINNVVLVCSTSSNRVVLIV